MRFLICLAAFVFFGYFPACAQESYSSVLDTLTELNRIAPLQNPQFDSAEELLSRRILDRKNKTVGEIRNIVVNENGSISSLGVEFDRLRLSADIFLNYRETVDRPASQGYILRFDADTLEDRFAELLAATEKAAGRSDVISVRDMIDSGVKASDTNETIGRVSDVLFSNDGEVASALYIEMTKGMLRGKYVAIPFNMVTWKQEQAKIKKTAILSANEAQALIALAKEQ